LILIFKARAKDRSLRQLQVYQLFSAHRHDGQWVALRIHRNGYYGEAALRSELLWREALAGAGITVPQIIRAQNQSHQVEVTHQAIGEPRHIDMLAWLPGATAGTSENGVQAASKSAISAPRMYRIGRFTTAAQPSGS